MPSSCYGRRVLKARCLQSFPPLQNRRVVLGWRKANPPTIARSQFLTAVWWRTHPALTNLGRRFPKGERLSAASTKNRRIGRPKSQALAVVAAPVTVPSSSSSDSTATPTSKDHKRFPRSAGETMAGLDYHFLARVAMSRSRLTHHVDKPSHKARSWISGV